MRWLPILTFYVKSLFTKRKLDAQLSEEMRTHVEMATEANVAKGMAPEEARYAALREFGNIGSIQERAREQRGWLWLEQMVQDVRYAVRQLVRTPGFTAIVVLTLALGIGGTTAIFSMVDTVILNPVGGPEPERMVQIGQRYQMRGGQEGMQGVAPPVLEAVLSQQADIGRVTWSSPANLERKTDDFINLESGWYVAPNFFATMQCPPLLGRGFLSEDAVLVEDGLPAADTAIVLSHAWWQSTWGGDREILGRNIELGGRHFTVVGIMPAHFRFPDTRVQYWLPVERIVIPPNRMMLANTKVFARLKPGVTAPQVRTVLDSLAGRLMETHPVTDPYGAMWRMNQQTLVILLRPLSVALQDGGNWAQLRSTLLGLLAAICFVLLIVCANVANLSLARLERRQHELAVRAAVGASRGRLMRQLLTENLVLALLGGIAGLMVTSWALKVLVALNVMPRLRPIEINGQVLGVTLGISVATAIFFGLAPMLRGGKVRVQALLADGGLNATGGRTSGRYRDLLVVAQVAMTVVLLTGAGLMLLSVSRILKVNPGFDPQNLLYVDMQLPWRKYDIPDRTESEKMKNAFIAELHQRFLALPGVTGVGVQQVGFSQVFEFRDRRDSIVVQHASVGSGAASFFQAMRAPMISGRDFAAGDESRTELVIINETLARQLWPGESAAGKKLGGGKTGVPAIEVAGVVNDARTWGYLVAPLPMMYHPLGSNWNNTSFVGGIGPQFVIRSTTEPATLIPFVRRALKEVEPGLIAPGFKAARQVLYDSTLAQRTYRNYLGLFAGLGLLLSALGVYGVLAFSVARRTREIGIRIAVGADASRVRAMVLRQGTRLIGTGIVGGLLATVGLTRFLRSQLFQVSPVDPLVMGAAVLILSGVALFACWLPARRAAKVDPIVALRAE